MKTITLGKTHLQAIQNGFGALPIQRIDQKSAIALLQKAYQGGIRFYDTARNYTDSEEKLGLAFKSIPRDKIIIATKTSARTPEKFWQDLETSLTKLQCDYIDIYQFHLAPQSYYPNDGTGMYECMLEAKRQGKIKHIGITAHKIQVAFDAIESGYYETLQFPFSYLSSDLELKLVLECQKHDMGFIAMKGLAGGLINQSKPAMAFMNQFDHVMPIWGIQRESELDEWLSYIQNTPVLDKEMKEFIEKEKQELAHDFCRGCGYCMPCPMNIQINQCARMSLMLRRAPSANWLNEYWQEEMKKIETCIECHQCSSKCPYELNTPELLKKNLKDYQQVLEGKIKV